LALHIISAAGFGVSFNWNDSASPWPNHKLSFYNALSTVLERLFLILLTPNVVLNLPFGVLKESQEARSEFGQYLLDLMEREKLAIASREDTKRENLMAALIRSSEGELSDSEITGNVFIFLLAGHETTAHTLMYTMYMLSMHPDVQDKLKKEAEEVYGSREPQYEDFNSLIYTNAVASEVLRLFPPVTGIPKQTHQEQTLCGGKYVIPAGSHVTLNAVGVHYNTLVWGNDAKEFKPSRFDPREGGKIVKGSFIPFSEGARSCIGRKFANVEMVGAISSIVKEYTIHMTPDFTPEKMMMELENSHSIVTLQPRNKIPLLFKKRQ